MLELCLLIFNDGYLPRIFSISLLEFDAIQVQGWMMIQKEKRDGEKAVAGMM